MGSYQDLIVWQKSIDLAVEIYRIVKRLPQEELYGLQAQMRRAVISVPSNIAEGSARKTTKDFQHFLTIARGSTNELETQLILSKKLNYITKEEIQKAFSLIHEIQKMLTVLHEKAQR